MAAVDAKLVKKLRDDTGAGMMDCKKALAETNSDIEAAKVWLRQKGLAGAAKKAGRVAAQGLVESYIHTGGQIGVMVEVNCETDFVARRDEFKELARNIAMQIAACQNVEYVSIAAIPPDLVEREKAVEMGKDDLGNKPEQVREKIIQGRIDKRLKELSLMDQPYIRDQSLSVDELIKQNVALLGENIQVRRFSRFVLGEGIEKEETDFAAEVAAASQMGSPAPAAPLQAEAPAEVVEAEIASEAAVAEVAEAPIAEVVEAEPAIEAPAPKVAASPAGFQKSKSKSKKKK